MKPEVIWTLDKPDPDRGNLKAFIKCPGCGQTAWVDDEQFRGAVSIDCPDCSYHETHDLSNPEKETP